MSDRLAPSLRQDRRQTDRWAKADTRFHRCPVFMSGIIDYTAVGFLCFVSSEQFTVTRLSPEPSRVR